MLTTIQNPFNSPIVYVHWGFGDECLYVGMSIRGFSRPFSAIHKMWKHRKSVTRTDIHSVVSREEALALEGQLTKQLKPKYDESSLGGYSKFGKERHDERVQKTPAWTNDDAEVRSLLKRVFPKLDTSETQRKQAAAWMLIIHQYFRMGLTRNLIAEQTKWSQNKIKMLIRNISRAKAGFQAGTNMRRGLRPRGRPKKNSALLPAPSGDPTL